MLRMAIKVSVIFSFIFLNAQDTLTIINYNVLRFSGSDIDRASHIKTVIEHIDPDIVVLQEIQNQSGIELLLNSAFNVSGSDYSYGPLSGSSDIKNGIIYRSSKLEMTSYKFIPTVLRDINGYSFLIKNANSRVSSFTVFSAHLKASTGSSNSDQRWREVKELQDYIAKKDASFHYIVAGDFNVYTPNERAYKLLVDSMSIDLEDPVGYWSRDDNSHVKKFTQSTRSDQIGDGGASGGLDDRFDFILFSDHFLGKDPDLRFIENSYRVIGNDGSHFNKSVIDGNNSSVPPSVSRAIYYASDHYPVMANISYTLKKTTSPISLAGVDISASIGDTITLDGTQSYDPNGSIVLYEWSQVQGPLISINNSNSSKANIIIPQLDRSEFFSFKLKVVDNDGEEAVDYINISITINKLYTPYDIQISAEKGIGEDCYPSTFEGQNLEVSGIVTAVKPDAQYPNFFIQDPVKKEWAGIFVYVPIGYKSPDVGSEIVINGNVKEYFGLTELSNPLTPTLISLNNAIQPINISTGSLSEGCNIKGEKYEGMRVAFSDVKVTQESNNKNQFYVSDSTGFEAMVDGYIFKGEWITPKKEQYFSNITGIVHYGYGEYKILPSDSKDFIYSDSTGEEIDVEKYIKNYPNPFNSRTIIEFYVSNSSKKVKLDIINTHGQLVATLINGIASSNKVEWNGRDFNGNALPAGIYFARLKSHDSSITQKMVLLK